MSCANGLSHSSSAMDNPLEPATLESPSSPSPNPYVWPGWVGNKRRCDSCQKNDSNRRCDVDPARAVGCTWCRTRSEYMKTGQCTFSGRKMHPRPATKDGAFRLGLRHFCDTCSRENTMCDWAKDVGTQSWACSRCNAKGRPCKRDRELIPPAPGAARTGGLRARDPPGTPRRYRPVLERCLLCRQFGTHAFCTRTAARGCSTGARFGLTCLDAESGTVLPTDPDMAGTGTVGIQLLYERCGGCAEHDLDCDRTDPCLQCRLAESACVRQSGRNLIRPIDRIGLERPLYSLALGYGLDGIGSRRPPNRPDIPGPPYPLHTDARWPGSLHPRKNGAAFPRMTLFPGAKDITPVDESYMVPKLTTREKAWLTKGAGSPGSSWVGSRRESLHTMGVRDGGLELSDEGLKPLIQGTTGLEHHDLQTHDKPTDPSLQVESRDTAEGTLNPRQDSHDNLTGPPLLPDLEVQRSYHTHRSIKNQASINTDALTTRDLDPRTAGDMIPSLPPPARPFEPKPHFRLWANRSRVWDPSLFDLPENLQGIMDQALSQQAVCEYPRDMALCSLPTGGRDSTYRELCFGTCQELIKTKDGLMRCDTPVHVPYAHCEDRSHAPDEPFCICESCNAEDRAALTDPSAAAHPVVLTPSKILFARGFVCHLCLDGGAAEPRTYELSGYHVRGFAAPSSSSSGGADTGSSSHGQTVFRGPLTPGWGCACWKLLNCTQCRAHRLRNAEACFVQVVRLHAWELAAFGRRVCPLCLRRAGVDAYGFRGQAGGGAHEKVVWACLNCHEFVVADRKWAMRLLPGSGIGE